MKEVSIFCVVVLFASCIASGTCLICTGNSGWAWIPFVFAGACLIALVLLFALAVICAAALSLEVNNADKNGGA